MSDAAAPRAHHGRDPPAATAGAHGPGRRTSPPGYPQKDRFIATLNAIAKEADVVEVGVPFSDPMADGVTIQRASHAAIAQGVSLRWILAELRRAAPFDAPIVLMSYLNPLLNLRLRHAGRRLRAGRRVRLHRAGPAPGGKRGLQRALDAHGLALIQLVTPVTPTAPGRSVRRAGASSTP